MIPRLPTRAPSGLGLASGRFHRAYRHLLDGALAPHGLHRSEYGALVVVDREPGVTNADLARLLNVSPQATAQLLAGLTARGLIERTPHPTISRALATRLTPAGKTLLGEAGDAAALVEADLVSPLSPVEAATLVDLLRRCVDGADDHFEGDTL